MISKNRGELVAECDNCGEEFLGYTLDWYEFICDLKDEGWKIRKDVDEWLHFCPSCVAEGC